MCYDLFIENIDSIAIVFCSKNVFLKGNTCPIRGFYSRVINGNILTVCNFTYFFNDILIYFLCAKSPVQCV